MPWTAHCEGLSTEIELVDGPADAIGHRGRPPASSFVFRIASDWGGERGAVPYTIGFDPPTLTISPGTKGASKIGDDVEIEIELEACEEVGVQSFEIVIAADFADEPAELSWSAECREGMARFITAETYQGPLIEAFDFSTGEALANPGTPVAPMEGRIAVIALRFRHTESAPPAIRAEIIERSDNERGYDLVEDGTLDRAVEENRVVISPGEADEDRYESEAVFLVPAGRYRSGYGVVFTAEPEPEGAPHMFPDSMASAPELDARVVGMTRKPSASEDEGFLYSPVLETPERYFQAITDFWPVAWSEAPGGLIGSTYIQPESENANFIWEEALAELEQHRLLTSPSMTRHYLGIVRHPAGTRTCGIAHLNGYVTLASDTTGSYCGITALVHELGHNFGLLHADGGCLSENHDENYPYPGAGIGPNRAWWFTENRFVPGQSIDVNGALQAPIAGRDYVDVMSYCRMQFVSDYHYAKALDHRAEAAGGPPPKPEPIAASVALFGRVTEDGFATLEWAARTAMPGQPEAPLMPGELELTVYDQRGAPIHVQGVRLLRSSHGGRAAWSARIPSAAGRLPANVALRDRHGMIRLQATITEELLSKSVRTLRHRDKPARRE